MAQSTQRICLVIPVYNEDAGLDALVAALHRTFDGRDFSWSVLFVDDGSADHTLEKIRQLNATDSRIASISLSRNFGQSVAIAAGLRYARGDAVVVMDSDLQHPPEAVLAFIEKWREGYKVVFGQRRTRVADSPLRNLYSRVFHAVFRKIGTTRLPVGVTDFLLLDRAAVDAINRLDERNRFSKGLYAWIGFRSTVVPFDAGERTTGESKWSFMKLLRFALDGFVSFSTVPLKVWSYVGILISLLAIVYAVYFLIRTLLFNTDTPGFPSLIVSIMFFAGVQLISLGVIGEYLARIYEEAKGRPLFVVAEEIGVSGETRPGQAP